MNALVKYADEVGLRLEDVPEPTIGLNDMLIRVERARICGTDLHIWDWNGWAKETVVTPLVIGNEFAGRIVAVGSNVNDFLPGDRVSGEGHVVCGRCRHCLAGRRHLCANAQGVGVQRPGAFAELIAIPMTNVWKHADDVDPEVAAIFDPFGNAVHTALSTHVLGQDILIRGIYGREMYETWYQMTVMLQSGLDVRPVITHRFPWDEFERAFEVAGSGESGKVLLEWDTTLG